MEENQIKVERPNYHAYLTVWINKAVSKGGFTAEEARDALRALDELQKAIEDKDQAILAQNEMVYHLEKQNAHHEKTILELQEKKEKKFLTGKSKKDEEDTTV